jgi:tyrosyl-tRNA synthetase
MTITLLLNSEGKKMGKTEKGAVWLDPEKTSPYDFYQYWRNVGDADVIKCLKMLTFVPIEEIEEMEKHMEGAEFNKAKTLLAYELTKLVHGEEEANKADAAAKAIFGGGADSADMPTTTLTADDVDGDNKIGILTLLVKAGLCSSNGDARRLVTQNGIAVNGEKFTDPKGLVDLSEPVTIKKGKKVFHKVVLG